MTLEQIIQALRDVKLVRTFSDVKYYWADIQEKFDKDENGLYDIDLESYIKSQQP